MASIFSHLLLPKVELRNLTAAGGQFMERTIETPENVQPRRGQPEHESGLFSTKSVLNLQKLIFAGSPLSDSSDEHCPIGGIAGQRHVSARFGFPIADGKHLYCAVAPSLPGFSAGRDHGRLSERGVLRHSGVSKGVGLCHRYSDRPYLG